MDDGARRIEEMAVVSAGKPPQIIGERLTGEWACCKHGDGINIWQTHLLATFNRHQGMLIKDLRERGAVTTPIHGESTTGRNGMFIGGANHEGAQASQLLLQQTGGAIATQSTKTVAADQFSKIAAVVRR
jgi:hypothetical protein